MSSRSLILVLASLFAGSAIVEAQEAERRRPAPLRAGDPAPTFELETLDRKAKVKLSSFRGQKPVVLIFGSYT